MIFNGYNIISDPVNMVDRIYTKIQTRKFKNRRWVKKYIRKYSYTTPSKDILVMETNKTMVCHPIVYEQIRQANESSSRNKGYFNQ
jgi:hypothetical protein